MRLKTAEMVGATAGLHRDDARGQPFGKTNDARRSHPPPLDDLALAVQPHQAAAILAKINSENGNLHLLLPFFELPATITWLAEGAGHPISFT